MPLDKGRKRKLGGLSVAGLKPLQQLSVRQPSEGPDVEKGIDVPESCAVSSVCHQCAPNNFRCLEVV